MGRERYNKPFMRLIILAGAAACLYSALHLPYSQIDLRFLLLSIITICFGSRLGIEFSTLKVQITVSDTFVFLALLLYGGEVAVLLAAAEALCSSFRFSKLWLTRLFNSAILACSTFISAQVVHLLFGSITELSNGDLSANFATAIGVMASVQYLANSGLAARRESFKVNQPFLTVWKDYYLWTSITYFAGAYAAAITARLVTGSGFYAFAVTVPIISIIYFTYQAYRKQLDATAEQAKQAKLHAEEQKRISEALRESEEHFRSAFDHAAVGMALVATDGRWLRVNNSLCKLVGYSEEEMLQMNVQAITHPDDLGAYLADMFKMLGSEMVTSRREKRYIHKDGHEVWATVSVSAVLDAQGRAMHFIKQAQDITERKKAEGQLHRAAFYDSLTGLPNRALFTDHLELAINRVRLHPEDQYAVLFLDVDRFKTINDSLGHVLGDQLLQSVAKRLELCIRPEDVVSRFGGDEFAILLNGIKHSSDAIIVAKRVQKEMDHTFNLDRHEVFTSTSIGIALSAIGYNSSEEVLRDADIAMYRAKEQGRGQYEVFDKLMHARAIARLRLENDLRRAVERHEFEVYYQPIVNLQTGDLSGFEALVRWNHPERGLVSPAEFIPVAEYTELIKPIGQWVLVEACRQAREWQEQSPLATPLTMSVNLSGRQFRQADLVGQVKQALYQSGLDAHCLRLEITESMIMEDAEAATSMLRQLRSLNVQLSIDDFGTGYSSLSYLHRFPVNILKVDSSFVGSMAVDEESLGIVETIITLASKLKMEVVAEGIETIEQRDKLKALQCNYGQGYLYSRPVPASIAYEIVGEERRRQTAMGFAAEAPQQEVELLSGVYSM